MVNRVGHVGLTVKDLSRSVRFATEILGLRETERHGDTAYLTCNGRHHELVLTEGSEAGCNHIAFETYDPAGLDELRRRLDREKLDVVDAPLERGVCDAVRFAASDGLVIEVFYGMAHDQPPHYPTSGARPRKFEHITLKSAQKEKLEDILVGILGLRMSDRAAKAVSWLRASEEHHGVSVISAEVSQLHHYAWQIDDFASMARVGDHLMNHGRQFLWGPGHHGIGDNYFTYFVDDDGAIVEYSAQIQRIEDERVHKPGLWPDEPLSVNRWGNPPPPQAFLDGGLPLCTVGETALGAK